MKPAEKKLQTLGLGGLNRYQKINILFFTFFTFSMIFTIMKANVETSVSTLLPFVIFEIVFISLYLIGDKNFSRKIQVIFLFMISYFVIISNSIVYEVGYFLFIFVYFLSKKYSIFNQKKYLFHIIIFVVLITSIYISLKIISFEDDIVNADVTLWHILNQMAFVITMIFLIFVVFEDDIKRLTKENEQLNNRIEKSKIFVNLGENIAGLVHNLSSDLGLLTMSISILEEKSDDPVVKYIRTGKDRLESRIKNIITLAKYSQNDEDIEFSINDLLDSIIEIFAINMQYKRIKIKKTYNKKLYFYGNTSEISQIFENLIKNAYEALIEQWDNMNMSGSVLFVPTLELMIDKKDNSGVISFIDNGAGIKACQDKKCLGSCINCDAFKVGKTTKQSGTGLGLISVFRTLKKYKGDIKIDASGNRTTVSVYLSCLEKA